MTEEQIIYVLKLIFHNFSVLGKKENEFVKSTWTCDDTCLHHVTVHTKQSRMQRENPDSPEDQKLKVLQSTGNLWRVRSAIQKERDIRIKFMPLNTNSPKENAEKSHAANCKKRYDHCNFIE